MQRYGLNVEKFYFWICIKENKGIAECVSKIEGIGDVGKLWSKYHVLMNKKLLIIFFVGWLIFISANVFAQSCGTTGGFLIIPSQGCAPLKVQVKNQVPKAVSISYVYNFNRQQTTDPDKKDISIDSSYIYQKPGTYTILQFGSAEGTGFSLCKDVTVFETRPPNAELVLCQNGRVRLTLVKDSVAKAYDQIEINWGDASPVTLWKNGDPIIIDHKYPANTTVPSITIRGKYAAGLCETDLKPTIISSQSAPPSLEKIKISSVEMSADGKAKLVYEGIDEVETELFIDKGDGKFVTTQKAGKLGGLQSATIENLNPKQIYKFKLISKDFCDNPIESAIVNSLIINEGKFTLDETNSLVWEKYSGSGNLLQYQLKRDDKVIFTTSDLLNFLDSGVECGKNYKYEIVAIIENDVRSYSAPITITPKSSPPEIIKKAVVSVESNNLIVSTVELSGEGLTGTYNLIVERTVLGNSNFQKISGPINERLIFEDKNVNTSENSYCYRFNYENACKQSSPAFSEPVCSILLKNNIQEITWNSESPFIADVASYDLVQMDVSGKVTDELPKQLSLNHILDLNTQSAFSFKVKAHSADGNLLSYSNVISIKRDAIILIPDAFTPNGDGINERFEVKSYFISSFQMLIYNRWGAVIFQSKDTGNSWNGEIDGKPAPADYYIYKIDTVNISEEPISKTGSFLLIR